MTVDLVRESALAGQVVLWEESARDGAQAKTLMSADFRVWLAREHGRVFGARGPRHVVFAAGFPAVCAEEYRAVRRVALEAGESVSVAAVCRGLPDDLRQAYAAVRDGAHSRVLAVLPASDPMARVMVHQDARTALRAAADLVREARGWDEAVALDVCLADASRADRGLLAHAAVELTAAGASTVLLADTVGVLLPEPAGALFAEVGQRVAGEGVVLGAHLHNDLGLGLANTLAALDAGVRVAAGSWLGLAERAGMAATEQLLFLLTRHWPELLGAPPWSSDPQLTRLPLLARLVAEHTGAPFGVTTPIVGTGVGSISTGTPFVAPELFQPFDPGAVLGIEPSVVLTQLANTRVVAAVAGRLGHRLTDAQTRAATAWVKSRAFRTGRAVVDEAAFAGYLEGLTAPIEERVR
ncbi:2-isopropylmalate synthase [Kitasatospora viridis]|uniref:2-isopropylmalate synthase n=1 Tax=Kitasatospora viridis TaxID=281105 RepID=A0A561T766_9ACTN|nr:2-isopropylmalate synthase [Kitasatospora viridis]TWF82940.1 2-isopropylmalate synthase [Kitasatospora viridis]